MNIHRRLFWGLALMGFMLFFMLSLVIWKIRKVDTMIKSTDDFNLFRNEIRFYEQLGFKLIYSAAAFDGKKDENGLFKFETELERSFVFELFIFFLILSASIHF